MGMLLLCVGSDEGCEEDCKGGGLESNFPGALDVMRYQEDGFGEAMDSSRMCQSGPGIGLFIPSMQHV